MSAVPPRVRAEHPRLGFSLQLPEDWAVGIDEPGLPALVARPTSATGQAPALVVDVRPLPEPITLEQFELEQQQGLPQQLPGYQCLEITRCTVGGDAALFRLCDYIAGTLSVTGAQWTAYHGDDLVILSATTPSALYPDAAEHFDAAARSFTWEVSR